MALITNSALNVLYLVFVPWKYNICKGVLINMSSCKFQSGMCPRTFSTKCFITIIALHFGNFVTERAAKSIIFSKCVFNPSYGLPGIFKIKTLYLDLILDHIWAKLWAWKAKNQPKIIIKSIIYSQTWQ